MANEGIRLTREELYQRVWVTPAVSLARELGISDVALGKICRKMDVPKPPPGYWRKMETGHQPQNPLLPAPNGNTLLSTRIYPRREAEQLALQDTQLSQCLTAEHLLGNKIFVAETLVEPHPLIITMQPQGILRAQRSDPGDTGENNELLNIEVSDGALDRALRIMDAVLKAVESRGYRVKVSLDYWEKATRVFCVDADAEVQISLSERYREVERELTPKERKKPPYLIDRRLITVASGILVFKVKGRGISTKWWNDKKLEPLENRLNDIVADIITKLESLRLEDLAKKDAERRRLEDQKRREEEQERREKLHRDVAAWRKSKDIRAYLQAYEEQRLHRRGEITPGNEEDLWLRWARQYADSLDPLSKQEE